jgi:hypothetical protein
VSTVIASMLLAAPQPGDYDPSTGKGSEWGKAAPIGLLVILLLGVAMFFLLRSFTRQLKKVPATFDPPEPSGAGRTEVGLSPIAGAARVPASPDDRPTSPDEPGPGEGRRVGADDPPG